VVPYADVAGYNKPCRTVGGDYYDFFEYPNGRVALVLGDVSGKGMPASLMMMQFQARVQQVMGDEPQELASAMNRLNKATCSNCPSNRFITFFLCVLDPATGEVTYANAGHNPPFLVRHSGDVEMIEGGGPVLGILSMATYGKYTTHLDPGDVLVLYSDGVTEATNPCEEEFGEDRFAAVLRENRGRSAQEILSAVTAALQEWAAGSPAADDITLIVAKRTS
jgi:serine phosphatase RsbU (regulator of sigma subunit)